jgi:preprotein translocase subunit SecD
MIAGLLFASLLILGPTFWLILESRLPAEGVRLQYVLEASGESPGDPAEVKRVTIEVVRRRLESLGPAGVEVWMEGDSIVAKIAGIDSARAADYRKLLARQGRLDLCVVAPRELQERFTREGVVPPGFRAVENLPVQPGAGYEPWNGPRILVADKPILLGRQIIESRAQQDPGIGGSAWATTFELDSDGARRFDVAAESLYREKPPGRIAILFDGVLKSAPAVMSPSFGGHGQISGAKTEEEAKELAILLKSGPLPARLGRMKDGVFVPGEPVEERRFGPDQK